jgi:hypothetical protein
MRSRRGKEAVTSFSFFVAPRGVACGLARNSQAQAPCQGDCRRTGANPAAGDRPGSAPEERQRNVALALRLGRRRPSAWGGSRHGCGPGRGSTPPSCCLGRVRSRGALADDKVRNRPLSVGARLQRDAEQTQQQNQPQQFPLAFLSRMSTVTEPLGPPSHKPASATNSHRDAV